MRILVVTLLLICANASASANQNNALWYAQPATVWEEALPLGNGRLGAMIFGNPAHDTIQLNENTFWAGSPHNNLNSAALESLP